MAESSGDSKGSNIGKILGLAFVVGDILALAAGVALVYMSTLGYTPPNATEEALQRDLASFTASLRGEPVLYNLEAFNANLDGVPRRLIRIQISLEMLDEEGFEEVFGLGAEARDAINRILNAKTFDEIESVQGKLRLKNEIITHVNSFLENGVVKNVYFSNFVVQ